MISIPKFPPLVDALGQPLRKADPLTGTFSTSREDLEAAFASFEGTQKIAEVIEEASRRAVAALQRPLSFSEISFDGIERVEDPRRDAEALCKVRSGA